MGVLSPTWVYAQTEETRYFQETGHNVSGKFLTFYEDNGGLAIFGYPLTEAFDENGLQVQYFQRARLELYDDLSGEQRVQLGPLGIELGYLEPPLSMDEALPSTHPDKRYYPETGHTVSFAFLEFYEEHGGAAFWGYPITEWVIERNGRIAQYFERGKLEWYPENPLGQRVQPGMLGVIYVEQYVDPVYTHREDSPAPPPSTGSGPDVPPDIEPRPLVTNLQTLVSVEYPVIGPQDTQTIYVYVLDQLGQGVEGAVVEVEVLYPGGRQDRFSVEQTDANGYGRIDFTIGDLDPGHVVIVSLRARYIELEATAKSAFLPWW
jgi:hypothetical protein